MASFMLHNFLWDKEIKGTLKYILNIYTTWLTEVLLYIWAAVWIY